VGKKRDNVADLRFGVRRPDGYVSNIWRLWVTKKGDVYFKSQGADGVHKYSFHRNLICRSAYTQEHQKESGMANRTIDEWRRAETPPSDSTLASQPFVIAIPTDYLSRNEHPETKPVHWIDAAPEGGATRIDFWITRDDAPTVARDISQADPQLNYQLQLHAPMFEGEYLAVVSHFDGWAMGDFKQPSHPDSIFPDVAYSKEDPDNSGRPIRIIIENMAEEGGTRVARDIGGRPDLHRTYPYRVQVVSPVDIATNKFTRRPITSGVIGLRPPVKGDFPKEFLEPEPGNRGE
jgi:hypothetical protein